MPSTIDLLQRIFTLTSNVDQLQQNLDRMDRILRDHHERIVRLESRDEVLLEKAKNTALLAMNAFLNVSSEKLAPNKLRPPDEDSQ